MSVKQVLRVTALGALVTTAACGVASSTTASADAGVKLTAELPVDSGAEVLTFPIEAAAPLPRRPDAAGHGPYPIVLMHGMGGFNKLENLPVTVSYFNGVQADLAAHGETDVFLTIAPPYNTSEVRAAAIAPQLDAILKQTGAAKLNLIGHSQGGLDARILVSPNGLGYGDRVASVTTIATPHRGTAVADLALGLTSGPASSVVSGVSNTFLSLLEDGVYSIQSNPDLLAQANEMSTSYMASTFNPKYVDAAGVTYASYAGRTDLQNGRDDCTAALYDNDPSALDVAQPELEPTASYLASLGETNDGLVAVPSAKWGTFMQCVPADHLKECGMLFQNGPDSVSGFDHLVFFRAVVARLRAQGF